MRVDTIWTGARLMTMAGGGVGAIEDGVIAQSAGRLVHVGARTAAPAMEAAQVVACDGRWITPGLIDCHTHLVFGGDRAEEFEARLAGRSYAQLAAVGGIRATVAATRAADEATLLATALLRLDDMIAHGVTTVEIKSGYGLDTQTELRQLRVARSLSAHRDVTVITSLLAAHALPPGETDAEAYLDRIIAALIPRGLNEGLVDAVDAFCETIAFSPAQIDRLFTASRAAGLPVKLHADQLSDSGGAALAARHGALSADHLEFTNDDGVAAMAKAGTVAVLLPGAFFALRETRRPPIEAMRTTGVPIAVATDCNPGSSPMTSLLLAMNMAATLFGLTVGECLRGVTVNAARALGRAGVVGELAVGQRADLAIWSIGKPAELVYWIGGNPLWRREVAA